MSTSPKFFCTGSLRGPMLQTAANVCIRIRQGVERCSTPQARAAYLAASLDDIREVYADSPAFVSAVCDGTMSYVVERKRLLGE